MIWSDMINQNDSMQIFVINPVQSPEDSLTEFTSQTQLNASKMQFILCIILHA